MIIAYICDNCKLEQRRIALPGTMNPTEVRCFMCGAVMRKKPPRVVAHYKSSGFTKNKDHKGGNNE